MILLVMYLSGKSDHFFDVVSLTRTGMHTYQIAQEGKLGTCRITGVMWIELAYSCLCHYAKD